MSIRPIDFNGIIQRSEDVGAVKHQQEYKPVVDQQNIQAQITKNEANASQQVVTPNRNEKLQNQTDARKEGKGQYRSSAKKKKKKPDADTDGKVIKKSDFPVFDIKI